MTSHTHVLAAAAERALWGSAEELSLSIHPKKYLRLRR